MENPQLECESCLSSQGPFEIVDNIWMCATCKTRQAEIDMELANRQPTIENVALQHAAEIDQTVKTRADFFNSRTVSIQYLKDAIDADDSITNKHYELASRLDTRFKHLRDVLFPKAKLETEAIVSEQRAIQVYLNNLASKLRQEEREKLRLSDIQYKPAIPRAPKPVTLKKKIDKEELKLVASESGIPEYMLQTLMVARNIGPREARDIIKGSIKAGQEISKEGDK